MIRHKKEKMVIVPKYSSTNIITRSTDSIDYSPFYKGRGKTNFVCGKCDLILLKKTDSNKAKGFSYRCPQCYHYNTVKGV